MLEERPPLNQSQNFSCVQRHIYLLSTGNNKSKLCFHDHEIQSGAVTVRPTLGGLYMQQLSLKLHWYVVYVWWRGDES